MVKLPKHEYQTFAAVRPGPRSVEKVAQQVELDQSLVMAAAQALSQRGWVLIEERPEDVFSITEAGRNIEAEGLWPEEFAFAKIRARGGRISLQELPKLLGKDDVRSEVKWLMRRGWCYKEGDTLVATDKGNTEEGAGGLNPDKEFIGALSTSEPGARWTTRGELPGSVAVDAALGLLKGRGELFKRKHRVTRILSLTESGRQLWTERQVQQAREVTQLTSELIVSGKWRDVTFKRYDPNLEAAPRYPGKIHPLQRVIQETRRALLEMGFEEVGSPVVETAFWNFDALFQPQDHPAREMQDTFYMTSPERGRLPDDKLVKLVADTHEDGGDTGSTGWRYKWKKELAERLVLRTHTTATTIRALAQDPNPPRKVFSIGKTFRRENVDATHLPEFIQIDGIIIDEQANLATLLGTLAEFYLKMGAEEVRFRPSFFPYTEPSVEVFARMGRLGWVEMCGAGIFRPEVTRPMGCTVPVLAWGGGLERIAMMRFGLDDIRKLYWCDIDWLKEAKLCR